VSLLSTARSGRCDGYSRGAAIGGLKRPPSARRNQRRRLTGSLVLGDEGVPAPCLRLVVGRQIGEDARLAHLGIPIGEICALRLHDDDHANGAERRRRRGRYEARGAAQHGPGAAGSAFGTLRELGADMGEIASAMPACVLSCAMREKSD